MTTKSSKPSPRTAGCATFTIRAAALLLLPWSLGGCFWAALGGAAAETGYVAGQKDRTAGQTLSDQWIFTKVKTSLLTEDKVKSRNIAVSVDKGVVTLKGLVMTAEEKRITVALARNVKGVKDVRDQLKLP